MINPMRIKSYLASSLTFVDTLGNLKATLRDGFGRLSKRVAMSGVVYSRRFFLGAGGLICHCPSDQTV